jgi:hypothetical protein
MPEVLQPSASGVTALLDLISMSVQPRRQ